MAVTIALAEDSVVEMLVLSISSDAFGTITTSMSEHFKSDEIKEALRRVDAANVGFICQTKGHSRRASYLTTQAVTTSGTELTSRAGDLDSVVFAITGGLYATEVMAEEMPLDYKPFLMQENLNPQALTKLTPKYILDGNKVFHNRLGLVAGGATSIVVTASFPAFTYDGASTSLQSPDEFLLPITYGTCEFLMAKDGYKITAAGFFGSKQEKALAALGIGGEVLRQAA
jgi:hypothetical protein